MALFVERADAYPEYSPNGPSSRCSPGSMVPSRTMSAEAGTPMPYRGVSTTSRGSPKSPPAMSRSSTSMPTRAEAANMNSGCPPITTATFSNFIRSRAFSSCTHRCPREWSDVASVSGEARMHRW
jgi:hypothetical protein